MLLHNEFISRTGSDDSDDDFDIPTMSVRSGACMSVVCACTWLHCAG